MLTPNYNTVVQYNLLYTYGFQLCAKIASRLVREVNKNLAATTKK